MSDEAAETLLDDMDALRRRTRADRHAYWFPLLVFGLATVAAAPLYVRTEYGAQVTSPDGTTVRYPTTDSRAGQYWLIVLLGGALLTVWWYGRRGRRIGIEGRVGAAVVAATLVVIAYAVLTLLPVDFYIYFLWPVTTREFSALLVLAVGLLALAWQERSRGLGVTAALFAVTVVMANTYNVENIAYRLGWDPFFAHPEQARFTLLPSLLLPAAVLLAGAAVAGLRARPGSRRTG